jgi:exodeoxyribonuclease VII small subunit
MPKKKDIKFSEALKKLEKSVYQLENNDLDLEKFVDIFTEGVKCGTICQKKLNESRRKIDLVLKEFDEVSNELKTVDETELFDEE